MIERVIQEMCKKEEVPEGELRVGGQRWRISRVRAKIAWTLNREYRISTGEIARQLEVRTWAIAKAIRKKGAEE